MSIQRNQQLQFVKLDNDNFLDRVAFHLRRFGKDDLKEENMTDIQKSEQREIARQFLLKSFPNLAKSSVQK